MTALQHIRTSRAFTLVELLIAVAIVGIISVVIYGIFDTTSQNFLEVDQLADLNDRVRFAEENMRNQLQAAGSQSSPDSTLDDWVAPPLGGGARVAGLYPYAGWQNDVSPLPADLQAANPNVSFDGIVIAGAYDYPLAFEFAGMEPSGGARTGRIYQNYRGLGKLIRQDPFAASSATPTVDTTQLTVNWNTRLIRLADRQGYQQFVQPLGLSAAAVNDAAGRPYYGVPLPLDGAPFAPQFKGVGGFFGIDDLPEGDTGYDAALLDFFWVHVVPDEASTNVMVLVRDRLCGAGVVAAGGAGLNPANVLAATCPGGQAERVVIASYIADFQVWFDCANAAGAIQDAPWSMGWNPNDHTTPGDCMNPAAVLGGRARVGHLRISMHTKSERRDRKHIQFEDATGAVCPPQGSCDAARIPGATLRTYDFYPESEGASGVVTMQSDFELVNYVNRNP